MQGVKPRIFVNLAKISIALGLLIWLIDSGRLDLTSLLSESLNIFHLFGLLAVLANLILQCVRWWWLVRAQSISFSLGQAIKLTWIAQFFSLLGPGAAGGELVRGYYIARDASEAKVAAISTVIVDRVVGLYALLWIGIPPLLLFMILPNEFNSTIIHLGILLLMALITMSILFLIFWIRPVYTTMQRLIPERFRFSLIEIVEAYKGNAQDLFACFVLSLLAGVILMYAFLLSSKIVVTTLVWHQVFLAGPLVVVANSLPFSLGGVGVAETTASVLFAQFGVETGATIMLIVRLWLIIVRLPGGLFYLFRGLRSPVS